MVTSEKNIFDTKIESAGLGKIDSSSVTLTVKNRFADSYNSTPTRSGIPFPQGMLMSSKQLKLTDEHGSEIPLQARSLGYWPDQSIKWVLLDFQTDTHSNSEHVYVLEYGNTVTRKNNDSGLSLTENDDEITVDTGRLNIIFDKTRFAPFSNISHDNRSIVNGIEGQDRLEGVLSTGQVNIEIIDFWQQYPKSLKSHQEGLRIGICPQIEGNRYSVGGEEEYKLYYYLKDGTYKFREGASKTHTINIGQNLPPKIMPMAQTAKQKLSEK